VADSISIPSAEADKTPDDKQFARIIGGNLRRIRSQNNLSLEKLARAAGVSRAMLGQIELGQSVPTVTVLARIADAFSLPLTAFVGERSEPNVTFLPASDAKLLRSADGAFVSRALFPFTGSRRVEFYELRLAPGCNETSEAHASGTSENLVVAQGELGGSSSASSWPWAWTAFRACFPSSAQTLSRLWAWTSRRSLVLSGGRLQDGYITELEGIVASGSITGNSMIYLSFLLR
jgi:transcriptional regulator with XRE-family HTH domain